MAEHAAQHAHAERLELVQGRDGAIGVVDEGLLGDLQAQQPRGHAVLREQAVLRERAQPYVEDPSLVRNILADGCERARKLAQETMRDVREAMGLSYG